MRSWRLPRKGKDMILLEAPQKSPFPYGLTSIADVQLNSRALDGHVHTSFCGHGTMSYPWDCARVWAKEDTAERVNTESKVFTTLTMETCGLVGYTEPLASTITELGRSHALEQAFVDLFGPTAAQIGTGPVAPKVGLAMALQYAATMGPERPVIHMQAGLVGLVGDIERHGNHLETHSGALVSAGTGYDDAVWGATSRIWVTGAVRVLQSVAYESVVRNPEQNEATSVNETAYSMSVDCYHAYVEVNIA